MPYSAPFELDLQNEITLQILLSIGALIIGGVFIRLVKRLIPRYIDEPARQYRTIKIIRRLSALFVLIVLAAIWSPGEKNIGTLLTVIGAGLAISMREALLSLVGWMNIIIRSPYRQGDRIEVNGVIGDVIDIRLMHTTLMEIGNWVDAEQSTGRIIHVPNAWVFQHAVANYTRGFAFVWNELAVVLTFRSDWNEAREIMLKLAQEASPAVEQQAAQNIRRMSREYLVHFSILTPFVYVRIVPDGIKLTLRYLCDVRKRRGTEHAFTVQLLEKFCAHPRIEFAHATLRIVPTEPGAPPETDSPGPPSRHQG